MGCEDSYERLRLNLNNAVDTGVLESSRGGRNSWCGGELLRYQEELLWRRQLTKLQLTLRLERVGIKQD